MTSMERFGLLQRVAVRLRWKKAWGEGYEELGVIRIEMVHGQQKRTPLDGLAVWCIE